jgi:hypothetical protein
MRLTHSKQTQKKYFFLRKNHKKPISMMISVLLVVEQFFVLNLDMPLEVIESV